MSGISWCNKPDRQSIMSAENNNNFETVVIDGEVWAVTSSAEESTSESEAISSSNEPEGELEQPQQDPIETLDPPNMIDNAQESEDTGSSATVPDSTEQDETSESEQSEVPDDPEFDPLRALTSLLVGGAIEGASQLTTRLQIYQEELRQEAAELAGEDVEAEAVDEDELIHLRYALVGLIFDAQSTFRRNVSLWAKIADRSARATSQVTQPVTNSVLFSPFRQRYRSLTRRGEESLARWIADGRVEESPSRELARRTYTELVDEFIDHLAENPELQSLITEQSIGVASDMRDEVRERTVTADNLMEGLVRRILHRTPRAELPGPPPEVQRWAGLTIEEYRAQEKIDEAKDESS